LVVTRRGGTNRLETLFQDGAAKIRFPDAAAAAPFEAVLITTSGGLTGGDRMEWEVGAGAGTSMVLTTQASEKIYRAGDGEARVGIDLSVASGASLSWLPQETILFDGAALQRTISVALERHSRLLLAEPLVFGRREMGEAVRSVRLRDRWRISVGGDLVHAEDQRLEGDASAILAKEAIGGGASAFVSLLLVEDAAERWIDPVRSLLAGHDGVVGGASVWRVGETGKLLARIAAKDGYCLRKALQPLLALLNGQAGLPRIWAT
jgi:urease accessory protein